MTQREIVQSSESTIADSSIDGLRQTSRYVDPDNLELARLISIDLLDTMSSQPLCVGLAANQIGEDLRLAVIQRPDQEPLVLVNPTLISVSGKKDKKRESCMSVWGVTAEVERRTKALVAYQDLDLTDHEETFEGFLARVVQHEIDHLNGVLYLDHASTPAQHTNLFDGYSPRTEADELP